MDIRIKPLTKAAADEYLNDLIGIDGEVMNNYGTKYSNEHWGKSHFLKDIEKKWEYSQLAISGSDEKLCGFVITSEMLENEIHIHRFAVSSNYRRKGVGNLLISKIVRSAQQNRCKRVTVEVSRDNDIAIAFYKKFGFIHLSRAELSSYVAKRKQGIQVIDNFIRESDGSESYILQKSM